MDFPPAAGDAIENLPGNGIYRPRTCVSHQCLGEGRPLRQLVLKLRRTGIGRETYADVDSGTNFAARLSANAARAALEAQ